MRSRRSWRRWAADFACNFTSTVCAHGLCVCADHEALPLSFFVGMMLDPRARSGLVLGQLPGHSYVCISGTVRHKQPISNTPAHHQSTAIVP